MPNLYSDQPQLDTPFPKTPAVWTDPITGLVVPKNPEANLKWRAEMLAAAENDQELQVALYTACSQSVLFFVNSLCFTLRVHEVSGGEAQQAEHTHMPFVTWEIQDEHILRIERCMEAGESLLTDKSRDMGATWDHIIVLVHRLLFRPDEAHLLLSRKEDLVDVLDGQPKNYPFGILSDPDTLFGKIDYVLNRLPEWMLPRLGRKKMHLVNLDTRTRIDGESTNAFAGSGGRRKSVLLDEMAKMKEGASVKQSTKAVSLCRLVNSTPVGAGTAFSKWRLSGQIPVFVLPWWEHPEKGFGRYAKQDDVGRWKIRSPWYDKECEEATPKEVATELDMDHVGSGDTFFEANVIEQHKKLFARPPRRKLTLAFKKGTSDDAIQDLLRRRDTTRIFVTPEGPWRVWCSLNEGQRPDQSKTYTLGVDVGKGQGASNSVISIMCNETREKIAEYADANTPPYEVAKIAVIAALWCGGRNKLPLIIWENNGDPGFDFQHQLVHVYSYSNIYFARQSGTLREKQGKRYGWRSNTESKATALGILRRAYAHGKYINHSADALTECLSYVHYEGGGIGPAELVHESDSVRKAHGDRVIADMLTLVALREAPRRQKSEINAPERSFGYRLKQFKDAKKAAKRRDRFDFTTV